VEIEITAIYVICDDILKILNIADNEQSIMSNAEVMAFSIIAAKLFGGNHKQSRWICKRLNYFPSILSESRISRRIHKLPWFAWMAIFRLLSLVFTEKNQNLEFAVDSFPISSCAKNRIDKRRIFLGKEYIGYVASKKRHFCGIKVHMVVTRNGEPVQVMLRPGSENDLSVLWKMDLPLPSNSKLYADGAYNSYDLEDLLSEDENITLLAKHKA